MPLYEYECDACGERFEKIQKFSDPPVDACARCGKGPVRRLLSSPAIQFKGSGWYVTDYARKSASEKAGTAPAKDTKKDSGPDVAAKATTDSTSSTAKTDTSTSSSTSSGGSGGPSKD